MDLEEAQAASKAASARTALEWQIADELVPYLDALETMEKRAAQIRDGQAGELIWLLEHPPLITSGTSAKAADLLAPERFEVFHAGRGGQYTYHGPGQRIAYCLLDLRKRGRDLRLFVSMLEAWMISALAELGIRGERREGRVGIWIADGNREAKIGAIGVRVRHWITFHGMSLNVRPDLSHFDAIVPCGVREHGVTSLEQLGLHLTMDEVDDLLQRHFRKIFDA